MLMQIFNEDWLESLDTFEEVMWFLILYLIMLVVMAIFLKLALGLFSKSKNTEFGRVFLTSFLITIIFAVTFLFLGGWLAWVVALVLTWIIISASHSTGFGYAILISIVAFLIYVLVAWLIGLIIGVTLITLPF